MTAGDVSYHAQGKVLNLPAWRLALSKGLSWLYRPVLDHKLTTCTSCFRVYRRGAVMGLPSILGRRQG
jgi:dolichol-phosphate mannosyltransferase